MRLKSRQNASGFHRGRRAIDSAVFYPRWLFIPDGCLLLFMAQNFLCQTACYARLLFVGGYPKRHGCHILASI
jgi:hypothetical protein